MVVGCFIFFKDKDMVLPPLRSGRSLYQQPLAALFVRLSPVR